MWRARLLCGWCCRGGFLCWGLLGSCLLCGGLLCCRLLGGSLLHPSLGLGRRLLGGCGLQRSTGNTPSWITASGWSSLCCTAGVKKHGVSCLQQGSAQNEQKVFQHCTRLHETSSSQQTCTRRTFLAAGFLAGVALAFVAVVFLAAGFLVGVFLAFVAVVFLAAACSRECTARQACVQTGIGQQQQGTLHASRSLSTSSSRPPAAISMQDKQL